MKKSRASVSTPAGPLRWSFRTYKVHERVTPFGRRFEVRGPDDEPVAFCRAKRGEKGLRFFSDEEESEELFQMEPKKVRLYASSYEVLDARGGRKFAEVRKKEYKPVDRSEWFILDEEGNPLGMLTESSAQRSFLWRLLNMRGGAKGPWALHWGQAIAGKVESSGSLMGEELILDLSLDREDAIDRRLALAVTVAMRVDVTQGKSREV